MTKIRRLYYFDKKNTKEMISFLNNGDNYVNHIMFNPLSPLHCFLPLRFKFLPETYVLKDKKEMKGLITIEPSRCPLKQVEIQKLLFEAGCYDYAEELIHYAVSKYKAMGCASVIVRIDDYLPELIKLFVSKCGFSQISYEKLWFACPSNESYNPKSFRLFRDYDASTVATMYNEQLLPHFRTLLGKDIKEFKESFFKGLSYMSEYKYIYKDVNSKNILACLRINTSDNKNYIMDIIQTSWEEINLDMLISFAFDQIKKRSKDAKLFIKSKKYTHQGEIYEKIFLDKKYECVQNKLILTNSSAKIIRNVEQIKKFTVLNQFYGGVSVVNRS